MQRCRCSRCSCSRGGGADAGVVAGAGAGAGKGKGGVGGVAEWCRGLLDAEVCRGAGSEQVQKLLRQVQRCCRDAEVKRGEEV